MKFEELSKSYQEDLIYDFLNNLEDIIIKKEGKVDYIDPTHEEIKDAFIEWDRDYEVKNGNSEQVRGLNFDKISVSLDYSNKVILGVIESEIDDEY